jgi:hypothetical protein
MQMLFVTDDEIGTSILPLKMLIDQQPWGKQYIASLGSGQGRAELTFHLHSFDFPDNPSPPLVTPLDTLEKRFGNEIRLPDSIQPPANVVGLLQVTIPSHRSHSLLYAHSAALQGKVLYIFSSLSLSMPTRCSALSAGLSPNPNPLELLHFFSFIFPYF